MDHEREYLRNLRLKCGYSQQEVAERLGVSKATISKYEKGQRRLNHVEELAALYGVSEFYIFMGKAEKEFQDKLEAEVKAGTEEERSFWEETLLTEEIQKVQALFNKLNEDGIEKALERIQELTEIPRYQYKEDDANAPQDNP